MWPASSNLDDQPRRAYDDLVLSMAQPRPPRLNERLAVTLRRLADRLAPAHSSPARMRRIRSSRSANAFSAPRCVGS